MRVVARPLRPLASLLLRHLSPLSPVSRSQSRTMGILGLSKLIADVAPSAIKENEMKNYFGMFPASKVAGLFFFFRFIVDVFFFFFLS